jgi:hypothetical protein
MPARVPSVCGLCGGAHLPGERCAARLARVKERKARAEEARPGARARGYDADWQRLRARHLAAHPACVRCGEAASVVDHVVAVRLAPHRRLDPANLQSLCVHCHSSAKQAAERRPSERIHP